MATVRGQDPPSPCSSRPLLVDGSLIRIITICNSGIEPKGRPRRRTGRSKPVYCREAGASVPTIKGTVSALCFFFGVTLRRRDPAHSLVVMRRPYKALAVLGVVYDVGLRVPEVAHPKVDGIDSEHMSRMCKRRHRCKSGISPRPAPAIEPGRLDAPAAARRRERLGRAAGLSVIAVNFRAVIIFSI